MMNSWSQGLLLSAIIFVLQPAESKAASFLQTNLKDKMSMIDAILVGNIVSIETKNLIEIEQIKDITDVDLYSIVTVENAQTLEKFGLSPIQGKARIYIDGGIIRMPEPLKNKYKKEYLVQGNTALPIMAIDTVNPYIFFVVGNGKFETPFLDIEKSVLKVSTDGSVLTNSGRPILGIVDDDLVIQYERPILDKPDFAEGPVDPNPKKNNYQNVDRKRIQFSQFIEDVKRLVAYDESIQTRQSSLMRPNIVNRSFGVSQ